MNVKDKIKNIQNQVKHYLYEDENVVNEPKKIFQSNLFHHINVLGTGAFGYVLQSIYKENDIETIYALKIFTKSSIKNLEHITEEVYILKLL